MGLQWEFSDSEEEEEQLDLYMNDTTFDTREELEEFILTIGLTKAVDSDEEDIDYEGAKYIKKVCTCGHCEDIWSGDFEHICCQQTDKWKSLVSEEEAPGCILETEAFPQATNMYAVRNVLMLLHKKKKFKVTDPPKNNMMRYGFYRSAILFIGQLL